MKSEKVLAVGAAVAAGAAVASFRPDGNQFIGHATEGDRRTDYKVWGCFWLFLGKKYLKNTTFANSTLQNREKCKKLKFFFISNFYFIIFFYKKFKKK